MRLSNLTSLFLYLAGILIVAFTFKNALKRSHSTDNNDWKRRLEEEHHLQFVRARPLDPSLLLQIDFNRFPSVSQKECQEHYLALMRYAASPMINLKDQSNFDLKRQYGAQIVQEVSDYEQNYTDCMQQAIRYAEVLLAHDHEKEAQVTLELCLQYHCDLSKCYLMMIQIYKRQGNEQALQKLRKKVEIDMQTSPFLNRILREFNEDLKESV